jgi:hypothetical protein
MTVQRTPAQQARELRESLRLARELAHALVAQADRVRLQCQQLEDQLSGLGDFEAYEPVTPAEPAAAPARRDPEEPARLAAMEMALQGRDREEIMAYLRRTLDDERADHVIAAVFDQQP